MGYNGLEFDFCAGKRMEMKKTTEERNMVQAAVFGFGTVGSGVVEILDKNAFAVPIGRFIYQSDGLFVGIDNSGGDAWVEKFQTEAECLLWLSREKESDDD